MMWYEVVWRGVCGRILAEFHLSGGKKVGVDFLVHALKVFFSVGVPGGLRSMMEGAETGGNSELSCFMEAILTQPEKRRYHCMAYMAWMA